MMAGAGGAMRATGWRATAIRFQQFGEGGNSTSCSLSRIFGWSARGLYPLARGCRRIWRGEPARPARAAWAVQRLLAARW